MFFRKQKTPTKNSGQELINKSNQQGDTVGDGDNNRVLVGYQQDGFGTGKDFGIKVSQDGKDVATASDDELVMSSAFNMFKIVQTGTIELPELAAAGASVTESDITIDTGIASDDNLAVIGFVANSGASLPLPEMGYYYTGGGAGASMTSLCKIFSYTQGGTVWVSVRNTNFLNAVIDARTVRYYLLRETAQ